MPSTRCAGRPGPLHLNLKTLDFLVFVAIYFYLYIFCMVYLSIILKCSCTVTATVTTYVRIRSSFQRHLCSASRRSKYVRSKLHMYVHTYIPLTQVVPVPGGQCLCLLPKSLLYQSTIIVKTHLRTASDTITSSFLHTFVHS